MSRRGHKLIERLDAFLSAGLGPETAPEVLWRVRTLTGGACLFIVIELFWVAVTALYFRIAAISLLFVGLAVITVGLLWFLQKRPSAVTPIGHCVTALVFIAIVVPNYLTGGATGANLTTLLLLPFASVLLVGKQALPWIVISGAVTITMFALNHYGYPFPQMVEGDSLFIDSIVTMALAWAALSAILLYYERTRRLTAEEARHQREAALAAAEAKSAFLANVSHEIRTPLGGIIGMNRLMLETTLDEEQRDYATSLHTCADSLLEIVDDVLDLSKMEAGRLDLEETPFSLHTTAEEVCSSIAVRAHEKGLELVCDVAPGAVRQVKGDRIRLEQVLRNLVGNAVKFTRQGQVVVRLEVEMVRAGWATVRFTVSDTGIGIPDEAKERIFESFTQVDASTTRQYGGTGLGLRIARDLVSKMGGLMGLESEAGKGSTFWFTAVLKLGRSADITDGGGSASLRGRKALIVDDNEAAAQAAMRSLRALGIESSVAHTVNDALDRIITPTLGGGKPFDLCLVDAQMKDDNGEPATEPIRRVVENPPPVILLAPAGARRLSGEWRPVEAVAVVTKPIRRSELLDALVRTTSGEDVLGIPSVFEAVPELDESTSSAGRVLVVEDEPVSRKILVRTLERIGLEVVAATHGREAVEILSEQEFDLVFMDVQMPEMDGLAVTRLVRDSESSVLQHGVPIVAVTAHAFPQSREACLEAGMSSVITKPIRSGVLRASLERYLGPTLRSAAPQMSDLLSTVEDADPSSSAVLDPAVLLSKLGDNPEFALEVLELWFEDAPKRISALEEAIQQEDALAAHTAAHALKGGAANAGAERFRHLAERIDEAARRGDLEPARELHSKLRNALAAVEVAAKDAFTS